MIAATCHCGAVRIEIPGPPQTAIDCNCSICRRYGALWSKFDIGAVRIAGHPEHTDEYIWGDKTLKTLRCRHCGCVTHWEPLAPTPGAQLAVNIRNFDPAEMSAVRIRKFDGAGSWTFVD